MVQARSDLGPRRSLADKQVKGGVIAHRLVERMAKIIRPSGKRGTREDMRSAEHNTKFNPAKGSGFILVCGIVAAVMKC